MLIFVVGDGNRVYDVLLVTDPIPIKRYSVFAFAKYEVSPVKSDEF